MLAETGDEVAICAGPARSGFQSKFQAFLKIRPKSVADCADYCA
jgi:hypothetical protein